VKAPREVATQLTINVLWEVVIEPVTFEAFVEVVLTVPRLPSTATTIIDSPG